MLPRMRHGLPPLDSLWAFHLVAETGSLTAAAALLNVAQPAVSKRLRELEALVDCALVRRGANSLSLTPAGARYAEELRQGFAQIQAATRNLQTPANAPLRVRAYTTWALRWLIPRLSRFKAQHPPIDVEVSTSTAEVDLAREGVDAAIRSGPRDMPPAPHARRLQPVTVAPFAAPLLADGRDVAGLLAGNLLGSRVRPRDWPAWLRHNGLPAQAPTLFFESTTLAIQAAVEGLGTVICTPGFVAEEVRAGRLREVAGERLVTPDCYWLILPQGHLSSRLQSFVDWLIEEAGQEAGGR